MKSTKLLLFIAVAAFQVSIGGILWWYSVLPHWYGKEVVLAVAPVDPRDLLRGQYVALNYNISRLPQSLYHGDIKELKRNTEIFVVLANSGEVWEPQHVTKSIPVKTVFVRGRVSWVTSNPTREINVDYSFDRYYTSPDKAKELEKELRNPSTKPKVRVNVLSDGRAAIKDFVTG